SSDVCSSDLRNAHRGTAACLLRAHQSQSTRTAAQPGNRMLAGQAQHLRTDRALTGPIDMIQSLWTVAIVAAADVRSRCEDLTMNTQIEISVHTLSRTQPGRE